MDDELFIFDADETRYEWLEMEFDRLFSDREGIESDEE